MRDEAHIAADGSPVDVEETIEVSVTAPEAGESFSALESLQEFVADPEKVNAHVKQILVSFGYLAIRVGGGYVLTIDGQARLEMVS